MKQLIIDCMPFIYQKAVLKEGNRTTNGPVTVTGVLQRAGEKNQNGRIYPKQILEREVNSYNEQFIKQRRAVGELDHPETSVINLRNVSHNIVEMHWVGDDLVGTIEILPTPSGNILKQLFEANIRVGISSRGLGSVEKIDESTDKVQDDYEIVCWDFVSNPSVQGSFMFPTRPLNEGVEKVKNPLTGKWDRAESIVRSILQEV